MARHLAVPLGPAQCTKAFRFIRPDWQDLRYNPSVSTCVSHFECMASTRQSLKLDEQFFQSLLSAAFTIQEYNERTLVVHCAGRTEPLNYVPSLYIERLITGEAEEGEEDAAHKEKDPSNTEAEGTEQQTEPHLSQTEEQQSGSQIEQLVAKFPYPEFDIDLFREFLRQKEEGTEHQTEQQISQTQEQQPESQIAQLVAEVSHLEIDNHLPREFLRQEAEGTEQQTEQQLSETQEQQLTSQIAQSVAEVSHLEIDNHLLRKFVQQVLQATHATGAAIALEQQGRLICRDALGDFASEAGALINSGSGFTGVCASSGIMQFCSNTTLDRRVDADACRKVGVSAIVAVPLFLQDRLLGLIAVFSPRPYAFGTRDMQALQDLVDKFASKLQLSGESANHSTGRKSMGGVNLSL
jgi:putative methionine-R-sulfoxide reductase with GAF domain